LAIVLVALGMVGSLKILGTSENWFALAFYGLALLLALICLGVAWQTGGRFLWYGVSIFLAVVVFGAGVAIIRTYHDPKLQPMVAFVKTDAGLEPIKGVYVGQNGGRLYFGSVKQLEPSGTAPNFISSVSCDQVVQLGVGPLVSLKKQELQAALSNLEVAVRAQPVPAEPATSPESGRNSSTQTQAQSGTTTAPNASTSTNSTSTTPASSGGSSSKAGGCPNGSD
jgi:hypothetical protein